MTNATINTADKSACERCGQPVRVQILEGYRSGRPVLRFFCIGCADNHGSDESDNNTGLSRPRLDSASALILIGACIGILGAWAERFGVGQSDGFGIRQQTAAGIGALTVLVSTILRIDVVAVFGVLIFVVAAFADVIGVGMGTGAAAAKLAMMVIGTCLIVTGLIFRRFAARRV